MFLESINNQKPYDVVIIGTGPAGMSLALELEKISTQKILLVDSGLQSIHPDINKLQQVHAQGDLPSTYFPLHTQKVLGGSSSVWAGFCSTLEERSFLNNEWPLDYDELAAYYPGAADILELPKSAYEHSKKEVLPGSDIIYKPYFLSPPVRFNAKYQSHLQASDRIDVLLGHTCTHIDVQNQKVTSIKLKNSLSGADAGLIQAKHYVLACGGLGNPRLLQLSNIGKDMPIGQYFMDHPHIYNEGEIELNKTAIDQVIHPDQVVHALQLSDTLSLEKEVLSFTVEFNTRKVEEGILLGKKQPIYKSKVIIRGEMPSLKTNKVFLSTTNKDTLQQPQSEIDFSFKYQEIALQTWQTFSEALVSSGLGRTSVAPSYYKEMLGGGHLMGTTRMGFSREDSVVDNQCKVHGVDNLFVSGSSLYSACAAANPTFTIVAFALRLAHHLHQSA